MTDFWAAIIGAIVGAVAGGGIAAGLQLWQYKREKRDRDRGTAQSLFFKVLKIHSDLEGYRRHVSDAASVASAQSMRPGWQSLRPIGNGPGKIAFSAEEMALLLNLKNFDLFNLILSLDAVHGSTIDIFDLYTARRTALTSQMPPSEMNGTIGSVGLTAADLQRLGPALAELDDLVDQIKARVDQDATEAWQGVTGLNDALRPLLGYRLQLEPVYSERPVATVTVGRE